MAATRFPKVAQVQLKYLLGGNNLQNDFMVSGEDDWTVESLTDLIAVFAGWAGTAGADVQSEDIQLIEIIATDLTSLDSPRVASRTDLPIAGTVDSQALPANATWAIIFQTAKRGRGRQGRIFFCGLAENQVDGNQVDGTVAGEILSAYDDLKSLVNAGPNGAELVIGHSVVDGVHLATGTTDPVIAITYTDLVVDSQRDRLPGHKKHKRPSP